MKTLLSIFLMGSLSLSAQLKDTVRINADNLSVQYLNYGDATYLMYGKAAKDGPATNTTLVKIKVQKETLDGKNSILVKQVWQTDTIIHTASTFFEEHAMKCIQHSSWWKQKGFTEHFYFRKKEVNFEGTIKEGLKLKKTESFQASLSGPFLNWHSDLLIFPLLPFRENCVFKINFYEPGYDKPKEEIYEVLKSETLLISGSPIDCWVLNYSVTQPAGYQRFWISKQSRELIKEEDSFAGFYRYKLKLLVDEQ
ncbi:MAG: hypothetical protein O9353_01835 [Bacteroidia bacterium]|nr:hypothetical protein [Bacteroidia bacterium]